MKPLPVLGAVVVGVALGSLASVPYRDAQHASTDRASEGRVETTVTPTPTPHPDPDPDRVGVPDRRADHVDVWVHRAH